MESDHASVQAALSDFGGKLDALETALRPVLAAVDEVRSGGASEELPPLMRARVDATLAYALNALFCMYLRTQGQDPTTHPLREEIGRVRAAYIRIHEIDSGSRARPRKRLHAALHVAEHELARVLTDGERALHQAANGRKARASDAGQRTTFADSSDEHSGSAGTAEGGESTAPTPRAKKRRRDEGSNDGRRDDDNAHAADPAHGAARTEERAAKREGTKRKGRGTGQKAAKSAPKDKGGLLEPDYENGSEPTSEPRGKRERGDKEARKEKKGKKGKKDKRDKKDKKDKGEKGGKTGRKHRVPASRDL
jgi:hypothetical protein